MNEITFGIFDHIERRKDEPLSETYAGRLVVGSPATVRAEIEQLVAQSGINYFAPAIAWGGLSHDQAMRSLRLFADEVMPHFLKRSSR